MNDNALDEKLLGTIEKVPFKETAILIWTIILIATIILRLTHAPGGLFLMHVSSAGFGATSIFGLYYSRGKSILYIISGIISLLWFMYILGRILIPDWRTLSNTVLLIYGIPFCVLFAIYYFRMKMKNEKNRIP